VTVVEAENSVEEVSQIDASLRHYCCQFLSQLELLPDDHISAEIFQRRISLRYSQGKNFSTYRRYI